MAFNLPATGVKRKNSARYSTYCRGTPMPPLRTRDDSFNTTRRTSTANKSRSLETLNFVREASPKDIKYEVYDAEYNKYLGKKLLAKMLLDDKKKKLDQVSKCLVSLKLEYEELLKKNIGLKKDIIKMLTYAENITELNKQIVRAKEILKVLQESKYDLFLKDSINALDIFLNQVQLVDITEKDMEEFFERNILGCESNIYKTLTRMYNYMKEHGGVISEIAKQCEEIEALNDENIELKKLSSDAAQSSLSNSIEKNYLHFFTLATENLNLLIKDQEVKSWKPIFSSTPSQDK